MSNNKIRREDILANVKFSPKDIISKIKNNMVSIVIIVSLLIYVFLINKIGFIESSALFAVIILLYMSKRILVSIIGGATLGVLIWALINGFNFYIPPGICLLYTSRCV